MMKTAYACGFAAALMTAHAVAGESSIIRKGEWQGASIESFLPSPSPAVPWLNIDSRTKLPKGDFPVGRHADAIPPLDLPAGQPPTQMSANERARRL